MRSIIKDFAKAALIAGGTLFAATTAQAQQQTSPAEAFNRSPTCLSFDQTDRGGVTFPDQTLHQYDAVLKEFAEGLRSYSAWNELEERMAKLGGALNGVCVYSYGEEKGPVSFDGEMGSIDINIFKKTPWGNGMQTPEEVKKSLDTMIHYATFSMNSSVTGAGMVPPILTPDTAAFLRSVMVANGHAEAVLATVERGLEENRLAELESILFENSPMFKDEIALLYSQVVTTGALTDADRENFKIAVIKSMLENPGRRANDMQATGAMMQQLAKQNVNIAELFNLAPDETMVKAQLAARFGVKLAELEIDGKPLYQAYKDFWAGNPNDPATPMLQQMKQLQQYVGQVFTQKAAEDAKKKEQELPPVAPHTDLPQPTPLPRLIPN